jgi:hypothetical protein
LTARKTPGAGLKDTEAQIDMARLRSYRLARVREQLKRYDYGACVLYDPINIRYATGTRNMALWTQHSPDRYAFVPAEGPVILFDREAIRHQIEDFDTVDELRPAVRWYYGRCKRRSSVTASGRRHSPTSAAKSGPPWPPVSMPVFSSAASVKPPGGSGIVDWVDSGYQKITVSCHNLTPLQGG